MQQCKLLKSSQLIQISKSFKNVKKNLAHVPIKFYVKYLKY